jgi:hypothetical protein
MRVIGTEKSDASDTGEEMGMFCNYRRCGQYRFHGAKISVFTVIHV